MIRKPDFELICPFHGRTDAEVKLYKDCDPGIAFEENETFNRLFAVLTAAKYNRPLDDSFSENEQVFYWAARELVTSHEDRSDEIQIPESEWCAENAN